MAMSQLDRAPVVALVVLSWATRSGSASSAVFSRCRHGVRGSLRLQQRRVAFRSVIVGVLRGFCDGVCFAGLRRRSRSRGRRSLVSIPAEALPGIRSRARGGYDYAHQLPSMRGRAIAERGRA